MMPGLVSREMISDIVRIKFDEKNLTAKHTKHTKNWNWICPLHFIPLTNIPLTIPAGIWSGECLSEEWAGNLPEAQAY